MKLSLIVAVAMLALAHGTVPPSRLVSSKRFEVEKHSHFIDLVFFVFWKPPTGSFAQDATDLQKIGQYFEEMKNKMTQDLTEFMRSQDLTSQAQ